MTECLYWETKGTSLRGLFSSGRPDFTGKTANYSLQLVPVAFPSLERAFEVNFLLEQGKQEKKKENNLAESISRAHKSK